MLTTTGMSAPPIGSTSVTPSTPESPTINASAGGSAAPGAPTGAVGSSSTKVGTGPNCLSIEPALGLYMYSANNLDNTTTGLKLDSHNGTLQNVQNTPFPAAGTPTCVVAVGNGSHATQVVNP